MRIWIFAGVLLGGCATIDTRLPDILPTDSLAEQEFQEREAFKEIAKLRDRLMRVAHPVLSANADMCKKTWLDIGAISHTQKSYSKQLRKSAAREVKAKPYPTLVYVRPGSPADKAGLQIDDAIITETEKKLALPSKQVSSLLEGSEKLIVLRDGNHQTVEVSPESICGYNVNIKMTSTINAYATGRSIIVTSGMMNFVQSDEELALIVGHELAHNEMGHIRKIISNVLLSGFATRYIRPFESEADYVGMYYMARAGYDLDNVEDIWRRLGRLSPLGIARAKTHPKYPDRYLSLSATRKEIMEKKAKDIPLLPNMKDGS